MVAGDVGGIPGKAEVELAAFVICPKGIAAYDFALSIAEVNPVNWYGRVVGGSHRVAQAYEAEGERGVGGVDVGGDIDYGQGAGDIAPVGVLVTECQRAGAEECCGEICEGSEICFPRGKEGNAACHRAIRGKLALGEEQVGAIGCGEVNRRIRTCPCRLINTPDRFGQPRLGRQFSLVGVLDTPGNLPLQRGAFHKREHDRAENDQDKKRGQQRGGFVAVFGHGFLDRMNRVKGF